jgi:hypothetical protein
MGPRTNCSFARYVPLECVHLRMMLALVSLLLTAQAPATTAELRVVRSLCAEAALNLQLERRHQIPAIYAAQMRKLIRDQLQSEMPKAGSFARLAVKALDAHDERTLHNIVSEASSGLSP